ncbi:MAG TPA: alcohol dehydrogenase catalytic domain-containing protein [Frankiaceae bacterium]|nr:alcohol dehydrogenase catalytic domain-containing protein [Frankiaceae bacterium]
MRAAVLNGDHAFEVAEVPDPVPGPGELVLKVSASGICGSDLKAYKNMAAGSVMGHEFCGEIAAIGSGVSGSLRVGELVAGMPLGVCGRCRWCQAGEPAHCERVDMVGVGGSPGGFAECVRIEATSAFSLDESVGKLGALVEPLAVGLHTVAAGEIQAGDRVLVIGGGNVGAAVALWARRMGAGEIIVSDPAPSRREAAATFGATGVHDPGGGPIAPGFDVVFECVGAPGLIQTAVDAARVHGRVVIAGVLTVPDTIMPILAVLKEVQVRFAVYYRGDEFGAAAALLNSGGVDTDAFVSGSVNLGGVQGAFEQLISGGSAGKVLVDPRG